MDGWLTLSAGERAGDRDAGADSVAVWLLADAEQVRAFVAASGFAPDGAYRDRVVSPDGATLREVRLTVVLGEDHAG